MDWMPLPLLWGQRTNTEAPGRAERRGVSECPRVTGEGFPARPSHPLRHKARPKPPPWPALHVYPTPQGRLLQGRELSGVPGLAEQVSPCPTESFPELGEDEATARDAKGPGEGINLTQDVSGLLQNVLPIRP